MTEPYGVIIVPEVYWCTKSVQEFDYKLKEWVWAAEMVDHEHYFEFRGFKHFEKGQCRICGKKIEPYVQKYFQKHYENGMKYCFQFDCDGYFCEDCAKVEGNKNYFNDCIPRVVDRWTSVVDNEQVETVVYADGSRLEELTTREMAKMNLNKGE